MNKTRCFLKLHRTLLIVAAFILMVAAPTIVHGETDKLTVISYDGPFHGTEECALDICPGQGENFHLLTVEALYLYNANEKRLERMADNDCHLQRITANSSMLVALSETRDVYQLKTDHWEYLTHIPESVDGICAYTGYLAPAAGSIALSEEQFFFFYEDDDGTAFLCSYHLEDASYAYTNIPFITSFCAYNREENALVGVVREGKQDYMAQYDLDTGALSKLLPVEYSGYIECYDAYNNRAISGNRAGIVLTLESGQHYLLKDIPGTADLYVLGSNTLVSIKYHETTSQEVALYRYDLSSATEYSY